MMYRTRQLREIIAGVDPFAWLPRIRLRRHPFTKARFVTIEWLRTDHLIGGT